MADGEGAVLMPAAAATHSLILKSDGVNPSFRFLALCLVQSLKASPVAEEIKHLSAQGGRKKEKQARGGREEADGTLIPDLLDDVARVCLASTWRWSYGSLSQVSKSLRRFIRSGDIYEERRRLGVVEQWVYMFSSGDSNWKAFDPRRRLWMFLPPCLADYTFLMSDKESLSAGTHLLWLGREFLGHIIFRYDLATRAWSRATPMNCPRCLFASASSGPLGYVAGGNSAGTVLQSMECYNALTGTWEFLPDMSIPRQKASGCCLTNGHFLVIGGRDSQHRRITSAEEYDPDSRTWRTIGDMFPDPEGREVLESSPPLVAVVRDVIYCIDSSVNVLKSYDWEGNTWRTLGPIPVRADTSNGWGLAFKAVGDDIFVIGGYQLHPQEEEGGGGCHFRSRPRAGMAMFAWNPVSGNRVPDWVRVTFVDAPYGIFLSNCAVMTC